MVGSLMMPLILIDFELRRDYIAKVLCINRDKPITVCGGQCYLSEQFKKATEHQEDSSDVKRSVEISFFKHRIAELNLSTIYRLDDEQINSAFDAGHTQNFIKHIFKPPRFS